MSVFVWGDIPVDQGCYDISIGIGFISDNFKIYLFNYQE